MPERDERAESAYTDHLDRSRRRWDRWSDWYSLSEQDFAPLRERTVEALELSPGDRVLEVGCGPGVTLETLVDAVGPEGTVVAIDYSPAMLAAARERVEENGWECVELHRADATTADLGGPYDGAIAGLALSVMPDVGRAVENVHGVLEPGAPLGVFDVRPFPGGPQRVLNPLVRRFLRWYANYNPDGDVLGALEDTFETVTVREEPFGGFAYAALARRA